MLLHQKHAVNGGGGGGVCVLCCVVLCCVFLFPLIQLSE